MLSLVSRSPHPGTRLRRVRCVVADDVRGPVARRALVRAHVLTEGYARLEDLAGRFEVSVMTMHRDLDALEREGWLVKIRGGATANPGALVEAGVAERRSSMQREKRAIAAEAATLLAPGQTVFLDDSSTVLAMVDHLRKQPPMVLGTNFLAVVAALQDLAGTEVLLFGGSYSALQDSCHGMHAVAAIERVHADVFFMSTTAITDGQLLHRSEDTVTLRRAFMAHAAHNVLLVDHAKFGRRAPHVLCDVSDFDTVVVDAGIEDDDLALLRERCADVRVARG